MAVPDSFTTHVSNRKKANENTEYIRLFRVVV